ncbi:CPBP family intramembrane glutamic endopeptidase [Pontibacter cellulosilyticus]|uniref:CPBP family intramembrane metalloprotease n=1 Tax=Pontibacter cellulosilyticus TaxID=1720253 RepID=A0A923N480_9BACT|nr:CPBP family intramembrane glutamic endopeptidase [Pontibacter cellulosilyticus]MBC5991938.1 CPBP family intramembrane metalloprotease [Pontibacter cellulosilyticus]
MINQQEMIEISQAETSKTKILIYSLSLVFLTLIALWFRVPLEAELLTFIERPLVASLMAGSLIRFLIIICLSVFIVKKRLLAFNGLYPFDLRNPLLLLLLPVIVILLLAYSSYEIYFKAEPFILFFFGLAQTLVGVLEELLFRGIILPLLILYFAGKNKSILKAVWFSSLLFGAVHAVALIRNPESIWDVTNTVIFAIGIGFLFACLLLRSRNILVPIFLHFLIDFTNGAGDLNEVEVLTPTPTTSTIVLTLAVVTAMSLFFIGIGYWLMKRVQKEEWLQKAAMIHV